MKNNFKKINMISINLATALIIMRIKLAPQRQTPSSTTSKDLKTIYNKTTETILVIKTTYLQLLVVVVLPVRHKKK